MYPHKGDFSSGKVKWILFSYIPLVAQRYNTHLKFSFLYMTLLDSSCFLKRLFFEEEEKWHRELNDMDSIAGKVRCNLLPCKSSYQENDDDSIAMGKHLLE